MGGGDPLELSAEAMRQLGYQTVDLLVDLLTDGSVPPLRRATREEMEQRLAGPAPETGESFGRILERLSGDVLPFTSRGDHPGYFAFIPSCGTWPGALGDFIASALNVFAGSWMESAGPSQLELTVLDWFKEWIGYPQEAAGLLLSGGSAANMTALACAREALLGAMSERVVAYCSRPGPLVGRPGRPRPRFSARPATGAARRRRLPLPTRPAARGHGCRYPGWSSAPLGFGQRRQHQHRRHRPASRPGPSVPRPGRVVPRGRVLRGLRRAH